jgi:hypothetical protein
MRDILRNPIIRQRHGLVVALVAAALAAPAASQQQVPPGSDRPAEPPPASAEPETRREEGVGRDDGTTKEGDRRGALIRSMVGHWTGTINDAGQRVEQRITLGADMSYTQVSNYPNGFTLNVRATWDVTLPGTIRFRVADWSPKQYCAKAGACQPVRLDRVIVKRFRFVDDNTIRTDDGVYRREN